MDFLAALNTVCRSFDEQDIRYALIGGFALAMRGVQRATVDLDLVLAADDLAAADLILSNAGFERRFRSENVSHYRAADPAAGRIDLLHAFRAHALAMLQRADRLAVTEKLALPVAAVEDLIGLKVQAAFNDARRAESDWLDIRWLVEAAADRGDDLDWALIGEYLSIFEQPDRIDKIRSWHGSTD